MDLKELFLFIFTDEFIGSLLFPINDKYVLDSVLTLRDDLNILQILLIAFCGSFLGSIFNYIFGRLIANGFNLKLLITRKIELTLFASLILLPFGFFGTLASFLSGIMRMKFKYFTAISGMIYLANLLLGIFFHSGV